MCMCACVRSEALAALATVMPRTERHSGVRSDSGVCRMACSPMVRCGCEPAMPGAVCACIHVYCSDIRAPEVVGSITHHLCSSSKSLKSQCFQGFRGYILEQLPGTLFQNDALLFQKDRYGEY